MANDARFIEEVTPLPVILNPDMTPEQADNVLLKNENDRLRLALASKTAECDELRSLCNRLRDERRALANRLRSAESRRQ